MSNNQEDRNVFINFLAGMGLGALVGAAAALLMAPKPGTETRQDLANAAEEMKTKANKVAQNLSESSEDLVKKSKEMIGATREKVQSAIEAGKQVVSHKTEEITEQVESTEA